MVTFIAYIDTPHRFSPAARTKGPARTWLTVDAAAGGLPDADSMPSVAVQLCRSCTEVTPGRDASRRSAAAISVAGILAAADERFRALVALAAFAELRLGEAGDLLAEVLPILADRVRTNEGS